MDVTAHRFLVLLIIVLLAIGNGKKSGSRFTNLKCESYNISFAKFETCKLNVLGRGVIGSNIHLNLFQVPIHSVSINWSFWRRYSGYKPFLYNSTLDFCKFVKQPKKKSFEKLVLDAITSRSNLNHTCPYDHDIIVDNLVFNDKFLQTLPLPQGDYKIQLRFASDNIWRLQVDIFLLRDE
ncbi:uncharacterized protein LOC117783797 [Drosophila innubila]|uniref:uncharacterized protein LOC117783797 n=1 Tax=Drosophila innubila TaxID=198719 RepID=UPI00148D07BF|nr:uncharacterized protein LOC117783797 [Drosophila innubila]